MVALGCDIDLLHTIEGTCVCAALVIFQIPAIGGQCWCFSLAYVWSHDHATHGKRKTHHAMMQFVQGQCAVTLCISLGHCHGFVFASWFFSWYLSG